AAAEPGQGATAKRAPFCAGGRNGQMWLTTPCQREYVIASQRFERVLRIRQLLRSRLEREQVREVRRAELVVQPDQENCQGQFRQPPFALVLGFLHGMDQSQVLGFRGLDSKLRISRGRGECPFLVVGQANRGSRLEP